MKLTRNEVEKIADLARLKVSAEAADVFAGQLTNIFTFMEKLNELNTDQVDPTAYTSGAATPLREDSAVLSQVRDTILEHAPAKEDTLFKVPKVI